MRKDSAERRRVGRYVFHSLLIDQGVETILHFVHLTTVRRGSKEGHAGARAPPFSPLIKLDASPCSQFLFSGSLMPPECTILLLFLKKNSGGGHAPWTPLERLRTCGACGAPPLSTNPGSAPDSINPPPPITIFDNHDMIGVNDRNNLDVVKDTGLENHKCAVNACHHWQQNVFTKRPLPSLVSSDLYPRILKQD